MDSPIYYSTIAGNLYRLEDGSRIESNNQRHFVSDRFGDFMLNTQEQHEQLLEQHDHIIEQLECMNKCLQQNSMQQQLQKGSLNSSIDMLSNGYHSLKNMIANEINHLNVKVDSITDAQHLQRNLLMNNQTMLQELGALPSQIQELRTLPNQVQELSSLPSQIQKLSSLPNQIQELRTLPNQVQELSSLPSQIQKLSSLPNQVQELSSLPSQIQKLSSLPNQFKQTQDSLLTGQKLLQNNLRKQLNELTNTVQSNQGELQTSMQDMGSGLLEELNEQHEKTNDRILDTIHQLKGLLEKQSPYEFFQFGDRITIIDRNGNTLTGVYIESTENEIIWVNDASMSLSITNTKGMTISKA